MPHSIRPKIERVVATINESCSAQEAANLMAEKFIGSVVVTDSKKVTGIFTERDLMVNVVGENLNPADAKIKDVMSKEIAKVRPRDTCSECLNIMKENRCRHLLVYEGEEFIGIVSLRDLVILLIEEKEELIKNLESYIVS